jgi:hypothetical protein
LSRPRRWTEWLVIAVAAITILSALYQLALPASALALLGVNPISETVYLFRLASLLTGLFGGMLLHSSLSGQAEPTVLLWASLQKLLGAALVGLGVGNGTLATAALPVAGYDFAAGLFLLWYWSNLAKRRRLGNE